jgi:cytochrome P450
MTAIAEPTTARRIPPSPPERLLFGHLLELHDILGFYPRCKETYGDVFQLSLAGWKSIVISHPEAIEYVLVTNHRNFVKHSFFWRHVIPIFGQGLLTSEGEKWVRQRKLIQPAFHKARVDSYAQVMVDSTQNMLEGWRAGETRDVHQDLMHVTMEIVARALFGAGISDADAARVGRAFNIAVEEIAVRFQRPFKIPDWVPVPSNVRFRGAVRELDRLVYGLIENRRRSGEGGNDLLSMLLEARYETGEAMSDAQVRDEAITIFLAGHETTALALSWTFYLLSTNPEADRRLHEELASVLGGERPGLEHLERLEYTRRVVTESMRLYPPAYAMGRESLQECEIAGYHVPEGASVFIMPWIVHRDARWYPDPLRFDPDRWTPEFTKSLPAFAYLPFGGGPRRCIGNSFAMMEATLLLASIAQRFRLRLVEGHRVEPFASITLRPKYGMKMTLEERGPGSSS